MNEYFGNEQAKHRPTYGPEDEAEDLVLQLHKKELSLRDLELALHFGHLPAFLALKQQPQLVDLRRCQNVHGALLKWCTKLHEWGKAICVRTALAAAFLNDETLVKAAGGNPVYYNPIDAAFAWIAAPQNRVLQESCMRMSQKLGDHLQANPLSPALHNAALSMRFAAMTAGAEKPEDIVANLIFSIAYSAISFGNRITPEKDNYADGERTQEVLDHIRSEMVQWVLKRSDPLQSGAHRCRRFSQRMSRSHLNQLNKEWGE